MKWFKNVSNVSLTKDNGALQTRFHHPIELFSTLFAIASFTALLSTSPTLYGRTYAPSSAEPALEAVMRIQERKLAQESAQLSLKSGLFYFWQDEHLEGLKLATQNPNQRLPSTDSILLGQMMIAWGLFDDAESILKIALADAPKKDANIIWLHLAQEQFEAGNLPQSIAVIERNIHKPSNQIKSETNLLRAMYLIEQGEIKQAKRRLRSIPSLSSLGPYSLFNTATAYSKIGNTDKATELFDALMSIPAHSDELDLIRDRATLALGLTFLENDNSDYAALALEDIRQNSPYVNVALLAKGWAHLKNEEWDEAYSAWHALANKRSNHMISIEAKANLPTLFIQKKDWANAIQVLHQAQSSLDSAQKALQSERKTFSTQNWLPLLKSRMGRKIREDSLQLSTKLRIGYDSYQEIIALQQTLNQWAETLLTLDQWVSQRTIKLQESHHKIDELLASMNANDGLEKDLDTISGEFKTLNNQGITWSNASEDQEKLKQQLSLLRNETQNLATNSPIREILLTRLARLEGLLVWDVVQSETKVVRSVKTNQNEIARQVEQNRKKVASLKQQQHARLTRLQTWKSTYKQTQNRLMTLNKQIESLKVSHERHLKDLYLADLKKVLDHLNVVKHQLSLSEATIMEQQWLQKLASTKT